MHVHLWHLPRRTWLKRHVGRCQGNGGKESAIEFFRGSGDQGKLFKGNFKNKDACNFLTFQKGEQSTFFNVCDQRSMEAWLGENEGVHVPNVKNLGKVVTGPCLRVHRRETSGGGLLEGDDESEDQELEDLEETSVQETAAEFGEFNVLDAEVSSVEEASKALAVVEASGAGVVFRVAALETEVGNGRDMGIKTETDGMRASDSEDVGAVHIGENGASHSLNSIHPHACALQSDVLSPCVPGRGVGGVSVGSVGSSRWARGRWSARLSSPWCCPGCGLYGDGTLCMVCDVGEGCDQGRENSDSVNSRLVRGPEHREGTKLLKASSGIQVGFPVVDICARKCESGGLSTMGPEAVAG